MSEAKHTRGPWSRFGEPQDWPGVDGADGTYSVVLYGEPEEAHRGVRGRTLEEAWANARLIAAAPDLLEALKLAVEEIEDLRHYANNNGGMIDEERFLEGRAAISKATGAAYGVGEEG